MKRWRRHSSFGWVGRLRYGACRVRRIFAGSRAGAKRAQLHAEAARQQPRTPGKRCGGDLSRAKTIPLLLKARSRPDQGNRYGVPFHDRIVLGSGRAERWQGISAVVSSFAALPCRAGTRRFRKFPIRRLAFGDRHKCDGGFIHPMVASLHSSGHSPEPRLTEAARHRPFVFRCFG